VKTNRQILIVAIAGVALSVAARLIHYDQSLWCDEMGIPFTYAHADWRQIVAAGAGDYTPNNHVVYTILTKIILGLAGNQSVANITHLIRLPSLIALALAWPFRRRAPALAILLLMFAAVQPWLIAFSDEARGYALMTLLGIVATNLLPDGQTRWPIAYAMVVALMIYTVPVAGMLLIAHGLTVMLLRPTARRAWLRGALIGGGIAFLLFMPMAGGIWFYVQHPQPPPDSFLNFANALPRFALAGEYVPVQLDPASGASDPSWGIVFWIVPVIGFDGGKFLRLAATRASSADDDDGVGNSDILGCGDGDSRRGARAVCPVVCSVAGDVLVSNRHGSQPAKWNPIRPVRDLTCALLVRIP